MKLLSLLPASYLAEFRVNMQLCSAKDTANNIVGAARGGAKALSVQLDNEPVQIIDLPYNSHTGGLQTHETVLPGSLETTNKLLFQYTSIDILCIEKLELESMDKSMQFHIIQDYDPYAWDVTTGTQSWTSLTNAKISYWSVSCKEDGRALSQTAPFIRSCHDIVTFQITPVDECLDGSHGCDIAAICTDTQTAYECSCLKGHEGNGFELDINGGTSCAFVATTGQTTTCDGNSMALTFDANYFPDLHMTTDDLYMNGLDAGAGWATGDQGSNTCKAETQDDGSVMFKIHENIEFCGTNITYNDTHIIYKNAVQGVMGAAIGAARVITRERVMTVEFSCEYERVLDLSMEAGIDVMMSHYRVEVEEEEGEMDITMALFTDATMKTIAPADYKITVPEVLYVGVQMTAAYPDMMLSFKNCWSTPSDDAADTTRFQYITDGCGDEEELNLYNALSISNQGTSTSIWHEIQAFTFSSGGNDIYLYCEIEICDSSTQDCVPTCDGRRRREASSDGSNTATMQLGPFSATTTKFNQYRSNRRFSTGK